MKRKKLDVKKLHLEKRNIVSFDQTNRVNGGWGCPPTHGCPPRGGSGTCRQYCYDPTDRPGAMC